MEEWREREREREREKKSKEATWRQVIDKVSGGMWG